MSSACAIQNVLLSTVVERLYFQSLKMVQMELGLTTFLFVWTVKNVYEAIFCRRLSKNWYWNWCVRRYSINLESEVVEWELDNEQRKSSCTKSPALSKSAYSWAIRVEEGVVFHHAVRTGSAQDAGVINSATKRLRKVPERLKAVELLTYFRIVVSIGSRNDSKESDEPSWTTIYPEQIFCCVFAIKDKIGGVKKRFWFDSFIHLHR